MFPFQNMPASCNLQNLLASELRLCSAVTTNACDVTLRLADLNISALKQAVENWSGRAEKLGRSDTSAMPQWPGSNHFKDDIERATAYGLQMSKILLDLQGGFVKLAQQRAAEVCERSAAMTSGSTVNGSRNGSEPTLEFVSKIVDQASQGYAQWTNNMLHAMESLDSQPDGSGTKKKPSHTKRAAAE